VPSTSLHRPPSTPGPFSFWLMHDKPLENGLQVAAACTSPPERHNLVSALCQACGARAHSWAPRAVTWPEPPCRPALCPSWGPARTWAWPASRCRAAPAGRPHTWAPRRTTCSPWTRSLSGARACGACGPAHAQGHDEARPVTFHWPLCWRLPAERRAACPEAACGVRAGPTGRPC